MTSLFSVEKAPTFRSIAAPHLVERLRGMYRMAPGDPPQFCGGQFKPAPICLEAATEIERLGSLAVALACSFDMLNGMNLARAQARKKGSLVSAARLAETFHQGGGI